MCPQGTRRSDHNRGAGNDEPLIGGETAMNQAVIGKHIGQWKDPSVSVLGEYVDPHTSERAPGRHQLFVHPVHTACRAARADQIPDGHRSCGESVRTIQGGHQRARRRALEFDVRVGVDPRKSDTFRIAEPQRVRFARRGGLHNPHTGLAGDLGGAVGARVRYDDDVKFARRGAGQKYLETPTQHGLLIVRRDDDARERSVHGRLTASYAASNAERETSHDRGPATRSRPSSPILARASGSSMSCAIKTAKANSSFAGA